MNTMRATEKIKKLTLDTNLDVVVWYSEYTESENNYSNVTLTHVYCAGTDILPVLTALGVEGKIIDRL